MLRSSSSSLALAGGAVRVNYSIIQEMSRVVTSGWRARRAGRGRRTAARPYTPGQMTYELRRLRLAGLIRRIEHSNKYVLTCDGIKFRRLPH